MDLWGPYKWPKINGKLGRLATPVSYNPNQKKRVVGPHLVLFFPANLWPNLVLLMISYGDPVEKLWQEAV